MAGDNSTIGMMLPEDVDHAETKPHPGAPTTEDSEVKTPATTETERARLQTSTGETSTQDMPPPEAFLPSDLAMERNPMTSAKAPSLDHIDSDTAYSAAAEGAETSQDNSRPSTVAAGTGPSPRQSAPLPTATDAGEPPDHANRHRVASNNPNQLETSATGWLLPPATSSTPRITFDEYLTLSEITFEWGDSYDCKDWARLSAILAPTLMVDYTEVNGHKWDSMPASDFVGILSHIGFVGDPLVHTQHHIGASKWQKLSPEEVVGHHQLRAAHQRYTNLELNVVENKGHGHAMVQHLYRKLEGRWKLAGLRPAVRWNEFEFDKIFKGF